MSHKFGKVVKLYMSTCPVFAIQSQILMQNLWQLGITWVAPWTHEQMVEDSWGSTSTINVKFLDVRSSTTSRTTCVCRCQHEGLWCHRFGEHTSFLLARSRVVPHTTHTLLQLQLMAAIIASRLAQFVLSSLPYLLQKASVKLWSDNQIVLHWPYSQKCLKLFISNWMQ